MLNAFLWSKLILDFISMKIRCTQIETLYYLFMYLFSLYLKVGFVHKEERQMSSIPRITPQVALKIRAQCPNQDPGASAGLPRARRAQGPEPSCSAFSVGLARSATTTPRQHCILKTGSEAGRVPQLPFSLWPWLSFQTCAICEMEVIIMVTLQIFGRS